MGIGSLLWFLVRVIPKPSRATYPCMRAAAPIMSGFVVYLISLSGSVLFFRKARLQMRQSKYKTAVALGIFALASVLIFSGENALNAFAGKNEAEAFTDLPNDPMGVAKGIFPGRVTWVMDKDATNEACTNTAGDYWHLDKNTNQAAVNNMLANGLMNITGKASSQDAWDALFKYFNYNHNKGWKGYTAGEKIVVKLNLTINGSGGRTMTNAMNTTPQLVLALLEQLVDTLHIAQANITVGDPYRGFSNEYWDRCHAKYPNVHYFEGKGTDGREQTVIASGNRYFNSDNNFSSRLPQAYVNAAYLINMPCLKTHDSNGITLAAKNHQGSVIEAGQNAGNQGMTGSLHYDYPSDPDNRVMGMYRHIVDYMAHEKLGGNTLIYILDAIWSGRNWDAIVEKWEMDPFNTDWTSSLFLSQDAVAIESVGFDFLYYEYANYPTSHGNKDYPLWNGVQDYIHQAADPANWPAGIVYDPNHSDHHAPVGSLGVHEHWNDAVNKEYSKNLGLNAGIELATVPSDIVADQMSHVVSVTVPANLIITEDTQITASILPSGAANKDLFWISSDTTIAKVDANGLVKPVKNGDVTITAITADGNKTAATTATVDLSNSIRQSSFNKCNVFPNPVSDQVTLSYSLRENAKIKAEIYSVAGKLVFESDAMNQYAGNNKLTLNIQNASLENGTYLCKVYAEGRSTVMFTAKIIVRND